MADEGKSSFSSADTPHGFAKRKLVKGYCGGLFGRELERSKFFKADEDEYTIGYIDAFCWRGEYDARERRGQGRGVNINSPDEEEDPDDIAKWGSPIIALDRGLDRCQQMTSKCSMSVLFLAIHFVFNDIQLDNIKHLYKLTKVWMSKYGWTREEQFPDLDNETNIQEGQSFSCLWRFDPDLGSPWLIRTTFVAGDFKNIKIPRAKKTFTFIDPCGIKQIPFDVVNRFLGPGKEVFINLMVWTIRRSSGNPKHENVINKLFGNPEANSVIGSFRKCPEGSCKSKDGLCCTKRAYKKYVKYYEERISTVCQSEYAKKLQELFGIRVPAPEAVHFLFSKGRVDEERGDQFYMVYLSCDMDLKMVKTMKDAMQPNVQTREGGLRHTDFYSFKGINIPFGRKTTDEEEKEEIYKYFKGQEISLYDLKYWILVHSPFTFHSRPLQQLEKERRLTVQTFGDPRSRNNFKATDFSRPRNHWLVTFHNQPQPEPVPTCEFCGHTTKTKGGMTSHIRNKHSSY